MDNAGRSFKVGIAAKLAVALVLGTGAIFLMFALWNIRVHRAHAEALVKQHAAGIDEVIQRSTRYHMLRNDREALGQIIADIGSEPGIRRVRVYNRQGRVSYADSNNDKDTQFDGDRPDLGKVDRAVVRIISNAKGERFVDSIRPIWNEPSCSSAACHEHPVSQRVLGTIDTHLSLAEVDREIAVQQTQLWRFTLLGLFFTALASIAFVYLVLHKPIHDLSYGIKQVADGDLKHRLEVRSNDELSELAQSFNKMTAELDKARTELIERTQNSLIQSEKMASLGKLAATVAHELNNPLFGILTYARLALKQVKREELTLEERERLADKLTLIERESKRSGEIVKNLLTFARQAPRKVGEHDLNQLLERAIAVIRHRVELQQVTLESKLDPNLPKVCCDEGQLQQVLLVLLVNAIEAMPEKGSLTVQSQAVNDGTEVAISVKDTGSGIAPDVMPHIFEPFFTTKAETNGSGLGLAIAHGIVAQHGGTISVQSEPGKGAQFTVALPLANPRAGEKKPEVVCEQG
ncbi:MAG: HAMP domain-containing protein [Acidobacteria bacterium]|nr:HAMP domain-containing protein [Acidobacteriota bacterium]